MLEKIKNWFKGINFKQLGKEVANGAFYGLIMCVFVAQGFIVYSNYENSQFTNIKLSKMADDNNEINNRLRNAEQFKRNIIVNDLRFMKNEIIKEVDKINDKLDINERISNKTDELLISSFNERANELGELKSRLDSNLKEMESKLSEIDLKVHEQDNIRADVGKHVVKVYSPTLRGGGTGFFVKAPSGKVYIMSNYHVCQMKNKQNKVSVLRPSDSFPILRKVVKMYQDHDLCLIESFHDTKDGLTIASIQEKTGSTAYIVGHPKLYPLTVSKSQVIGEEVISLYYRKSDNKLVARSTDFQNSNMLDEFIKVLKGNVVRKTYNTVQFIGYSRGGNSGSPIVNQKGEVISVLFAGVPSDNLDSYGVPLIHIKELLRGR